MSASKLFLGVTACLLFGGTLAKTRASDVAALYLIKERALAQANDEGRWAAAVKTWSGKGEECLDCEEADPCGLSWHGNWHGVECRGQDGLPENVERVVTNLHLPDYSFGTEFAQFEEIALLSNLTEVDMDSNYMTGPLPEWMACLSNLLEVDLADNRFSGEIPKSWGHLSNMVELEVENNPDLYGCIPEGLPNTASWQGWWSTGFSEDPIVGTSASGTNIRGYCSKGDLPECPKPLTNAQIKEIIERNKPLFPVKDEPELPEWMIGGTTGEGQVSVSEGGN